MDRKRGIPILCGILTLTIPVLLGGCSQPSVERAAPPPKTSSAPAADPEQLLQERREKDQAFKSGSDSPIPEEDRSGFSGLEYYDYRPDLRFKVRLHRYPAPKTVRLGTNTGAMRDVLRYGYFEFEVEGQECRLQVYRTEEGVTFKGPHLFIPFRDATSGRETYGAGRYIDLRENTTGEYDLDFNRAYNPWCVYGGEYSCPVPPAENTLAVAIRAGEKDYPLSREQ